MRSQLLLEMTSVQEGIYVQLNKTVFACGETIQGIVHVNLANQYKGHFLQVSLQGYEEVQYVVRQKLSSTDKIVKQNHFRKGFNMFLNYRIPLYDFSDGDNREGFLLSPGQWSIPFQLALAQKLPTSYNYIGSKEYASVVYRINATIIPTDLSVDPMQGNQEVFIGYLSKPEYFSISDSQILTPKTSCCFSGSESLEISVQLEHTTYSPGDTAVIQVSCDSSKFSGTILSYKLYILGVLHLSMGLQSQFGKKQVRTSEVSELKFEGKNFQSKVEIPIPIGKSLSYQGDLIKQEYSLYIKPIIDGFCLNGPSDEYDFTHSFAYPITIKLNSKSFSKVEAPKLIEPDYGQNWDPTVIEPLEFSDSQTTQIQQQYNKYEAVEIVKLEKYLLYEQYA